ncbi:MAG: molybdenum-pterin-binding protein MopA [Pseudomonadota bacterium]|jgi:molybdate transport system regulatory protein
MQKPQAHVRVDLSPGCSIGPGKVALLEGIARSGSLSAAARGLGMSYRRAWLLLHNINTSFHEPAAALSAGGKDGGGARLTPFGQQLVESYREFESAVDALAVRSFSCIRPNPAAAEGASVSRRPLRRPLPEASASKEED